MIDATLSHYRILEKLGQGGMGVVYRAEDTTLGRQVAIKVLPDIFAGDPERLARFEREAKLLASLNHTNIAAIYGLEQDQGKRFLVLELVEGETLAQRIAKGPLPVDEALGVCKQIAEGLEAAHEKGIIHRDLKPANVKVTPEGKVKVLDFGLAKAFHAQPSAEEISQSPTISEMTRPGVVLGTAAYMAPEQAQGKAVNKRTDIWAFGCILYECISGRRAFCGETITETLAAILKGEPDWDALPTSTSWRIRELLHKCLRKDHAERLHDIGDARLEVLEASASGAVPDAAGTAPKTIWQHVIPVSLAALFVGIVFGGLAVWKMKFSSTGPSSTPVARIQIGLEPAKQLGGGLNYASTRPSQTAFAWTPDGKALVYWGLGEKGIQLYKREMADWHATPISGTEGGRDPILSPDGKWIGFWAQGNLKKVPIGGGTPITLCESELPSGMSWGSENAIIASLAGRLWRISADSGKAEALTATGKGEVSHILPHVLQGGSALLFCVVASANRWDNPRIEVLSLETGNRKVLIQEGSDPRYAPTGHLVFARRGTVFAAPFQINSLEVTGPPVPLVEDVMHAVNAPMSNYNTFAAQFSFSQSGALAYATGGPFPDMEHWLVWVDPQKETIQPLTPVTRAYAAARLSPDGKQVAYATQAKERQIWIYDVEKGTSQRLTFEGSHFWPLWTPDGKRVAFNSEKPGGENDIVWMPADASTEPELLLKNAYAPCSWSPDGSLLAFIRRDPDTGNDIWIFRMKDRQAEPFAKTKYNEQHPAFSPDGRYIAYTSDETGRSEVYVRSFPGPGGKWPVSTGGGSNALWEPSGRRLYFLSGPWAQWIMAVDMTLGQNFSIAKPQLVIDYFGLIFAGLPGRNYDLDARGQRFLGPGLVVGARPLRFSEIPGEIQRGWLDRDPESIRWLEQRIKTDSEKKIAPTFELLSKMEIVTRINVVQNWFEELKRLVPAGK